MHVILFTVRVLDITACTILLYHFAALLSVQLGLIYMSTFQEDKPNGHVTH